MPPAVALAGPVFVMERLADGVSSVGSVARLLLVSGSRVPTGGPTVAVLLSKPVAAGRTVAVAVKVATPAAGRSTVVAMSPVPLAAPQLAAGGGGAGPRHAGQHRRERIADPGAGHVARSRVGHRDGVGDGIAGDRQRLTVRLGDGEVGDQGGHGRDAGAVVRRGGIGLVSCRAAGGVREGPQGRHVRRDREQRRPGGGQCSPPSRHRSRDRMRRRDAGGRARR